MCIIDEVMINSHWELLCVIILIWDVCVICRSLLVDIFFLVFLFLQSVKNLGPRNMLIV